MPVLPPRVLPPRAGEDDRPDGHEPNAAESPAPARLGAVLRFMAVAVSFAKQRALDAVTAEIPANAVTGLIGPNGAGKTTLLNCVSGLVRYTGRIEMDGAPLDRLSVSQRCRLGIGRTFQTPILLDDATALDNVLLGGHALIKGWAGGRGGRTREAQARCTAMTLLDVLGISRLAGQSAGGLTHGDRRRVELARALLARPRLLLLDEPSAGMEDDDVLAVLQVAKTWASTCVVVDHRMAVVLSAATRVVVLDAGHVLASGAPDEIVADPTVLRAYLGGQRS